MKRAIAINDYTSQSPEQLSFHRGDRFYLLVDTGISEKWYFVTTNISPTSTTSESGFVPRDHVSIQNDETPVDENSSNSTTYRKNSTSSNLSSPRPPRLSRHSIHQCLTQSQKKFPNVVATVVLNCPATKEWELPVETGDVIRIVEDRGDHILALASSEKSGTSSSSSSRLLGIVPLTAVRFWNTTDGTPILKLNNSHSGGGVVPPVVGDGKYDEPSYVRVIGYKRNRQSSIDYKISVTTLGNHSYIVRRTYSDFVTLHANIIGSVANLAESKTLPVLPPSLSPEEERETAQRRGKALDLYIATIMALPMTSNRKSFIRKFLGFDDLRRRPSTSTLENTADVPMRPRESVEVEEKDQRISVDSAYRSRKSSTASYNAETIPHSMEPPPVPERWSEENSETSDAGSPTRKLSAYTDRFSVNMSALIDSYSYS